MPDRKGHLERAHALIACGGQVELTYAAVELRQLIERLVYEQLAHYSEYIPDRALSVWQPPQAFKALLQFEPNADKDFRLSFSEQGPDGLPAGPWVTLGCHKAFDVRWLTKTYNKLGSMVHAPHGDQKQFDPVACRNDLGKIAGTLQEIAHSTIIAGSISQRVHFECIECGAPACATVESLREHGKALCFNTDCGAVHLATELDNHWEFRLETVEATCPSCAAAILLPAWHIRHGELFRCMQCDALLAVSLGLVPRREGGTAPSC